MVAFYHDEEGGITHICELDLPVTAFAGGFEVIEAEANSIEDYSLRITVLVSQEDLE